MIGSRGRLCLLLCLSLSSLGHSSVRKKSVLGDAQQVQNRFSQWGEKKSSSPQADLLSLALGYIKGLSAKAAKGRGSFALNLTTGDFTVQLSQLDPGTYEISALENSPEGTSLGIDPSDWVSRLAVVEVGQNPFAGQESVTVSGKLPPELKDGFKLDFIVVRDITEGPKALLFGSPKLFDKWYFTVARPALAWSSLIRPLPTSPADNLALEALVADGEELFLNETFAGNGRTCGTCHRPENNFTIDAAFIATLPASDPLFVAENNPLLSQLEIPILMRQFGLILENVDGLADPTQKFTMRSVPHTLALTTSMTPDATIVNPPADMLGWSGDGSAGTGSLREFAIGAVVQHAPKSLGRIEGVDFRLPTDTELDAMEAFQLSLGRLSDIDLQSLRFKDSVITRGQEIFLNGNGNSNAQGRCQTCHANAGAAAAADGTNRNFNTGVEVAPHPARALVNFPRDGGFGTDADGFGGFGNGRFNSAPLIEAADTGPFFHNNLVDTIEDAVSFYNTDAFNATRAATARIQLTAAETAAVAALLRVLNTLENIRMAFDYASRAMSQPTSPTPLAIALAIEETKDAISSLSPLNLNPSTLNELEKALTNFTQAFQETDPQKQMLELDKGQKSLTKCRGKLIYE